MKLPLSLFVMNAKRLPSGEIAGDTIAGSAANAAGGGCATATGPRHSVKKIRRQRLFMEAPSRGRYIGWTTLGGNIADAAGHQPARRRTKSSCAQVRAHVRVNVTGRLRCGPALFERV